MITKDCIFLFTHGAGTGIDSDFMQTISSLTNQNGLETTLFNFPYMKIMNATGKRRPPDRMPKLIEYFKEEIIRCQKQHPNKKIVIGGKSMGGRVASLVAKELEEKNKPVSACICLGFPFHPPKKLEIYRGEHLSKIKTPILILQGERDTFGTRTEVEDYNLSKSVSTQYIPDGDHSFKPRVKSGYKFAENLDLAVKNIKEFLLSIDC